MYNYREAMVKDIMNFVVDNYMEPAPDMTRDEYVEALDDELWGVDMITGNGGFYYGTEEECAGYVGYGLPDLVDALEEFGFEFTQNMKKAFCEAPARYIDCLIRTHILYECIEVAVDKLGYFKDKT
jgi:hypothetical protein